MGAETTVIGAVSTVRMPSHEATRDAVARGGPRYRRLRDQPLQLDALSAYVNGFAALL